MAEPTDVSDESSVHSLLPRVKSRYEKADVLLNAAGTMTQGMVGDVPAASWWGDFTSGFRTLLGPKELASEQLSGFE